MHETSIVRDSGREDKLAFSPDRVYVTMPARDWSCQIQGGTGKVEPLLYFASIQVHSDGDEDLERLWRGSAASLEGSGSQLRNC